MTKHTLTKKLLSVTLSALTAFSSGAAAMTTAFYSAPAVYAAGDSLSPQDTKILKAEEKMMMGMAKEAFKSIPFFGVFADSLDSILDLTGAFGGGGSGGSGVSREDLDKLREHLDEELNHIKADIARLGVDLKNEINMTFYAGNLGQELVDMHTTSSLNADNIARYKNSADYPTENDRLVMVASLIGNTNDWSNNKQNLVYRIHQIGLLLKGTTYSDLDGKSLYQKVYDYYAKKSLFSGEIYDKAVPYINSIVYEYLYAYSVLMECMEASLKVARFTAEDEKALSDKVSEEYKKIKSNSASVIAEEVGAETLLLFNFKNENSLVSQYSNFLYNAENNRFTYLNKGTTLKAVRSTLGSYEPGSESEVGEIKTVKTNGSTDTNAHSAYKKEKSRLENALSRYSVIPCSNIGQMGNYVSENYANSGSVWNFLKNIGFTYTAPDNKTNLLVTNSQVRDDNPSAADGSGYNTYEHRYYLGYNGYVYNNQSFSPEDITVYALVDKKERDKLAYQAITYNHFYRTYIASPANSKPVNLFYFEGADEFKNTSTFDYDAKTNTLTVTAKATGAVGRQNIRVQYRENDYDNWTTSYAPTTVILLKDDRTYEVRTIISDEDNHKETTDIQYITTPTSPVLVERKEPYIDDNGDYKTGVVKHYEYNGKNYAVNADGSRGEELSDVTLSYFEFELLSDNTYQINYYTGSSVKELVIPKTYNGRKITVLSQDDDTTFFKDYKTGRKGSNFTLVLNENITTINKYAFNNTKLNKVMGDTSNLNKINASAFGNLGSLEIHLDYPGQINNMTGAMINTNAVIYLKHSTTFKANNMCKSVVYRFSDAHSFDNPVWYWAYDYEVVTMTVTCTNENCQETQMFYATITSKTENGITYYTATVNYNGRIYKDSREAAHTHAYSAPAWQWSDDHSTAKAIFTCTGGDDTQTVDATVTQTEETDKIVYTATAQFEGKTYTNTYIEEKPHIHTYGEPTWNWSDDFSTAKATFTCTDCEYQETVDAEITKTEENGKITHTAAAIFNGKTYTDTKTETYQYVPATEPYIDNNGAYILGTVSHFEKDGINYAVNADGSIGNELSNITFSYFAFELLGNDEYQINSYTGSYDALKNDELVIPKTFNGKKITHLGGTGGFMQASGTKKQFTLVLNENITHINSDAFLYTLITKVTGNTSGLAELGGSSAFAHVNNKGGYKLDIQLDNPKTIYAGYKCFEGVDVTVRIKHSAAFETKFAFAKNITYIFTDAHIYQQAWTWSDDHSSVTLTLTCTNPKCNHTETVQAIVTKTEKNGKIIYTATAQFEGKTYTNTYTEEKPHIHTYGEPTWNWSDDYSIAKATFTCTDCEYTETANAVIIKTEETNKTIYTATVEFDGETYTDTKTTEQDYVYVPAAEPYIDESGEYILGYIEHYEYMGKYYAVGNDKSVGKEISDIWISYFAFELLDNDTYAVKYYTGKTKNLTEIIIPKTFNDKKITVLGTDELDVFIKSGKPQFTLVLNENIREIKSSAFNTIGVKKVTGDTSGLNTIGDYAFSWANRAGNYELDITLDYPGEITVGKTIFNHVNATVHIGNATTFSNNKFGASKIVVIESLGSENNPYEIYTADDLNKYLTDPTYTGKYIRICSDITLDSNNGSNYVFGKDTVMNLDAHTITLNNAALLVDDCSLTVQESIATGKITGNYTNTVIVGGNGIFTLEFGGIVNTSGKGDSAVIDNAGTFTMNGGWIQGKHSIARSGKLSKIEITGGNVSGEFLENMGNVTIKGEILFSFDPSEYVDLTQYGVVQINDLYLVMPIEKARNFDPASFGGNSNRIDNSNNNSNDSDNSAVSTPDNTSIAAASAIGVPSSPVILSENDTPKTGDTTSAAAVSTFLLSSLGAIITLAKKRKRKEQA